jgi:hypothetical protein
MIRNKGLNHICHEDKVENMKVLSKVARDGRHRWPLVGEEEGGWLTSGSSRQRCMA